MSFFEYTPCTVIPGLTSLTAPSVASGIFSEVAEVIVPSKAAEGEFEPLSALDSGLIGASRW